MCRRQPRSAVFRMYGAEHARAIADGRVLVFEISADVETGWGNLVRHCAVLQRPGSDARFARASHWMQNAACIAVQRISGARHRVLVPVVPAHTSCVRH